MLRRSFVHLPGIGATRELRLWDQGIRDWDQLRRSAGEIFSAKKLPGILEELERSQHAYEEGNLAYFASTLPKDQRWRLLPECWGSAEGSSGAGAARIAFFDIETTGLGFPPMAHSTTVTFYYRGAVLQEYEHEKKRRLIREVLDDATMLVSFFGQAFDAPFLEREFGMPFELPHIDLCFWFRRLGYKGGLKKIEKVFPETSGRSAMDIDGYDAVRLWRMHERGVSGALETLLTYNAEDTVMLEPLLARAYNLEIERSPAWLGLEPMPLCEPTQLSTRIYPEVYALLKGKAVTD